MNILKIGLIAAVLWQGSVGCAEVDTEVNELPLPAVRQLCEGIIKNGNSALEYLGGGAPGVMTNTFGIGSNERYTLQGVNRILENVVVHPNILPFLMYRYDGGSISGVELSCDEDATETLCQKAIALLPSATHINIPMKKLPYPTPRPWKNNLLSLSVPGLKHVRREAFKGTSSADYTMRSIDLPSVESVGYYAFYNCTGLNSLKLPNSLKFLRNYSLLYTGLSFLDIPHFTHFLEYTVIVRDFHFTNGGLKKISMSDVHANHASAISSLWYVETLDITCYSRLNNVKRALKKSSISGGSFKNLNVRISDSIKHVVNTGYINEILAMNSSDYGLLSSLVSKNGRGFLDFSNTEIPETNLRTINKTGNLPWVLSFPHITTVDSSFNTLFKQLKGVILSNVGSVVDGAFTDCSGLTTLGFEDTTTFVGTPLDGLTPSILELTVTQPQNVPCFLSALEWAGLDLSSIEKFIIKFPNEVAQSANLGPYVASLLAVLPPPPPSPSNFSGNPALSSINNTLYFDLTNSNLSDIYDLPINEFSR
ncbi:MAG: leucine-rich repeat domain-containing protein, partial [Holosporales bacterium]|nr:leucine-rich repeat domain-containing protein [Holosporales bacterium]